VSGSGRAPQRAPVPVDTARAGREDARPPASELTTALHGDGPLLAPLSAQGEPQQFFWPHPDRGANVAAFALGLTQRVPGATTPADAIEGVAA